MCNSYETEEKLQYTYSKVLSREYKQCIELVNRDLILFFFYPEAIVSGFTCGKYHYHEVDFFLRFYDKIHHLKIICIGTKNLKTFFCHWYLHPLQTNGILRQKSHDFFTRKRVSCSVAQYFFTILFFSHILHFFC